MKKIVLSLAIITMFTGTKSANALEIEGRWSGLHSPRSFDFDNDFIFKFKDLPTKSKRLDKETGKGWSASYWPSHRGGITIRWNKPVPQMFDFDFPTKFQVLRMSKEQINQLSPAEKFDIYKGNYNYPLASLAKKYGNPKKKEWLGICHGWTPAAMHHVEPNAKTVVNPDGVEIGFASSDVKALLSFYYAWDSKHQNLPKKSVGGRCRGWRGDCKGVNPGALHIVLSNMLGIKKKMFAADVDLSKEIWNQPVVGFKSQVLGMASPSSKQKRRGVAKLVQVKTSMYYTYELNKAADTGDTDVSDSIYEDYHTWKPVYGTKFQTVSNRRLQYYLELDSSGNIIGGSYISGARPDFLWYRPKHPFIKNWSALNDIYEPISI